MASVSQSDMRVAVLICVLFYVKRGILAVDNFGLLYGSLRTFQSHACDGNELRLNCTANTLISINLVRYGREAGRENLCPGPNTFDATTCRLDSAIKVIEEKCRGQVLCRLLISPDTFYEDPCPGVRKYAEVAYKCKPESFRNKIICEGDSLNLSCPEEERLTIYSAFFGTTRSGVLECRQQDGIQTDDCQVSYATENLMKRCNGLQQCSVVAEEETLGPANCVGRKHLKVTYSCIHRHLLIPPQTTFHDKSKMTIHTTHFPGWARPFDPSGLNSLQRKSDYILRTSSAPPNTFRSEMQSDEVPVVRNEPLSGDQKVVGFMSEWMSAQKYVAGNKEKLILYVTLTTGIGFLVFLTVIIARAVARRIHFTHNNKSDAPPLPDDQFFSDSDLEQYDPPEDLPPPVVTTPLNYTSSLRRQSSDVQPRAPVTTGSELNHYFS